MKWQGPFVCLIGLSLAWPAALLAEHTRTWRESEFERGTARGVAIRSDGKLVPAPRFAIFSDPDLAYLWALQMDSRGRLYAAGGSDAKVLRLDDAGKATTVFESSELAAQAIVFDSHDNLYVGTNPDGKVYKVTPEGQRSVFFEPKTKYIWSLALDSQGVLFVATGDQSEVFAVTPDGKGDRFYQSEERHARSLAFDLNGNLVIGTEPNGLIIRVGVVRKNPRGLPTAGNSFVVYETNKKEVTSLISDASGNLYAAAIGEKARVPVVPIPPVVPVAPAQPAAGVTPSLTITAQTPTAQPAIGNIFFPAMTGGSEVVRISSDGSPQTVWSSREDLAFSLGISASQKVLLGTGNKGAIIELEDQHVFSSIAKTASAQVTSLLSGPQGKIYAATANPGKVFSLGPSYEPEGSFESDTFDAKIFSHWGRLSWWGENGATLGKVEFYARSGNTSTPEKNWSAWAGPYKNGDGQTVGCPPARFAQWKVVFLETDRSGPPSVSWVSLAYQPKNVAPVIDDVIVQEPGVRVQGFAAPAGVTGASEPVQLRWPQRAGTAGFTMVSAGLEAAQKQPKTEVPPQGFAEKGYRSVLWSAHDENDDDLVFAVYYRGEGEQNWRLLKDKIMQRFYSWDATTMPDGAYYLKIVASDSPSNPPDQALSAERMSDRFEIANTPPRIENLRAEMKSPEVEILFDGRSNSGPLARAQYSVDAGNWEVVFPIDLLSDAPMESYQIRLTKLSPGEHTVAVRISDRFENTTAAKVTFSVSGKTPR